MNTWWNKYVGIPYAPGMSSRDGCDCWGLVRLVYREEFGTLLPGAVLDVTPGEAVSYTHLTLPTKLEV